MLPPLAGDPIRVEIRRSLGPHLAATYIPKRLILLDQQVLETHGDFERILIHEVFHFVWVRLGNPRRRCWEEVLAAEISRGLTGELGWSSEWRKTKLKPADAHDRSAAWRRYACESFCDTAAWLYSGIGRHPEFTLPTVQRKARARWYERKLGDVAVSC